MLQTLASSAAAFRFNNTNNDYTNANTNTSSHNFKLSQAAWTLPAWQKMIFKQRALVAKAKMTFRKMAMKRFGNLYSKICSTENLQLAEKKASKGKAAQRGVIEHRLNSAGNMSSLQQMLVNKTYRTSPYRTFTIKEPKEREIFCLPFFPDRILHHAIMNVIKPVFNSMFTADSYASIEGKGTHCASYALRKALRNESDTCYCLKLDIKKFYPSVDHAILKQLLRRKFKDADLLAMLDEIIDSAEGLPIGNYLSQYFANFYLTYFDYWLKGVKKVPYYFRYKDDMVFLSDSKPRLHQLLEDIRQYLASNLKLSVKENYQVFPVSTRGIDFVGYVHFHTHVRLRKTIKKAFARKMHSNPNPASAASYNGWAKHCDSKTLLKKLTYDQIQRPKHNNPGNKRIRWRQDQDR